MNIPSNIAFLLMLLFSASAQAYIGPGLGAGTVGVILGVLGSIVLALFAIFWYPVKRLLKKGKAKKAEEPAEQVAEETPENVVESTTQSKSE